MTKPQKIKSKKKPFKWSLLKFFRLSGVMGFATTALTLIKTMWTEEPWWAKKSEVTQQAPQQPQIIQQFYNSTAPSHNKLIAPEISNVTPEQLHQFNVMSVQSVGPDFVWYIDILNYMNYRPEVFWPIAISGLFIVSWGVFEVINRLKQKRQSVLINDE